MVHTALHGVGSETVAKAFVRAGYAAPIPVASQAQPDPAFPTVHFPNPEEPGAMDAALELAEQTGPDVVIANDPDADRCAVAVPGPGGWRMLRGDEVGALLGCAHPGPRRGRATRSSPTRSSRRGCSRRWPKAAGVRHEETLTGFKWISRVEGLRYGYEEALGYCVDPPHVRDKDGVSAALVVAEMTATLKSEGRSLTDLLDDLAEAHGVHATDALSGAGGRPVPHRHGDGPAPRATRRQHVAGIAVSRTDDLAEGSEALPPTDGLRYFLADDSRIIVRPSGTEPKLKVYLEVIEPVSSDLATARKVAAETAGRHPCRHGRSSLQALQRLGHGTSSRTASCSGPRSRLGGGCASRPRSPGRHPRARSAAG